MTTEISTADTSACNLVRHAFTILAIAAIALSAGACSPAPETTESTTPAPRTAIPPTPAVGSVQPARVVLPDGFRVNLELAITPEELAQGLMFRPTLADDRGMLLVFAEERLPNIWMMNTLIALDLVYLDRSGAVVDVVTDAQPCPGEPCPRFTPKRPAQAVLEIPAGNADRHGIEVGVTLDFSGVPDYPVNS